MSTTTVPSMNKNVIYGGIFRAEIRILRIRTRTYSNPNDTKAKTVGARALRNQTAGRRGGAE